MVRVDNAIADVESHDSSSQIARGRSRGTQGEGSRSRRTGHRSRRRPPRCSRRRSGHCQGRWRRVRRRRAAAGGVPTGGLRGAGELHVRVGPRQLDRHGQRSPQRDITSRPRLNQSPWARQSGSTDVHPELQTAVDRHGHPRRDGRPRRCGCRSPRASPLRRAPPARRGATRGDRSCDPGRSCRPSRTRVVPHDRRDGEPALVEFTAAVVDQSFEVHVPMITITERWAMGQALLRAHN